MSDCCCRPAESATTRTCPACEARGAPVEIRTVKALLTPPALTQLEPGAWFFCADPACDTVYFSEAGQAFRTVEVRVGVWQKEPFGARMVCYCFGENEADMLQEIEAGGRSGAVDRIRRHILDARCACDLRNPRGACCLGDVMAAVKRLTAAGEPVS